MAKGLSYKRQQSLTLKAQGIVDIDKMTIEIDGETKSIQTLDDSASTRFVRTLEKGGYNFEVFEVDGTDCDDETVAYADSLECEYCNGFL